MTLITVPAVPVAEDAPPAEPHPERLYALLPAVYRDRDHALGHPLRDLLRVMEGVVYDAVRESVDAMYDDWFIETCSPWVVPYIGDLVGVTTAASFVEPIPTVRARVANALGYTRRKGTAWILARAARDASGWAARGVEYWRLLASTQPLSDVHLRRGGTARISNVPRAASAADLPFDSLAHTADVRTAEQGGRYGLTRLGLFLWRLGTFPLENAEPRQLRPGDPRYTFNPFGAQTPLFVPPGTEPPPGREPGRWQVPAAFTPALLRRALAAGRRGHDRWTAGGYPPVQVLAGPSPDALRPCRIVVGDLAAWRWPAGADAGGTECVAVVDPERGRLRFADGRAPGAVRVSWSYGFSAGTGGGPYARDADFAPPARDAWRVRVGGPPRGDGAWYPTLGEALAAWNAGEGTQPGGVITLMDGARQAVPRDPVRLPPGAELTIAAAAGETPWLQGDLRVQAGRASGLVLRGLWIDGTVYLGRDGEGGGDTPADGAEAELTIADCTVAPPVPGRDRRAAVVADGSAAGSVVRVDRSILGRLALSGRLSHLTVADSIVAAGASGEAVCGEGSAPGPATVVSRSTVFGRVRVDELSAQDAIFAGPVHVGQTDEGGMSHCYVAPGSRTPPRSACVPEPENGPEHPSFTSTRYGAPGFAQLAAETPPSILAGACDGSEMGAFQRLQQPQRRNNLQAALDEFLPSWMQVVVTYMT